jgi:protein-L-isoaspartate(D-aspartate) O-methyltransferase
MAEIGSAHLEALRQAMLQIVAVHVKLCASEIRKDQLDHSVMSAMARVPRHEFVPDELVPFAYEDTPLPIGHQKTISQPFIVALMTDLLEIGRNNAILEVGTGLGYHAAVLAELAGKVFTIELIEELVVEARRRLSQLNYANVETRLGDGSRGWPEHAPYDRIIVTAAPEAIPQSLIQQLKPGGKMVIPVGPEGQQKLVIADKHKNGELKSREVMPVMFSRLTISH